MIMVVHLLDVLLCRPGAALTLALRATGAKKPSPTKASSAHPIHVNRVLTVLLLPLPAAILYRLIPSGCIDRHAYCREIYRVDLAAM